MRQPIDRSEHDLTPARPPALEGTVRLRVRYCECDPMGVAHHAAYIPWLELARTELLRVTGVSYADMERAGVYLVVARLEARYKAPARYDDELEILTKVSGGGRARIDHEYEVWLWTQDAGRTRLLCTASSTLACVDSTGHPRALPAWLAVK
ncbi:MAG: acyl-CoA thioesterase [Phycisphaerales bacterium]